MSSPFPGMDPFLENPARWPTVHQGMISLMWMELNRILPKPYVADIGERVYMIVPPKDVYPDVYVLKHPGKRRRSGNGRAAAAVLEADTPVEVEFAEEHVREVFIQIHLKDEPGTLVGMIEILSPTNKNPGEGRELYLEKQQKVLKSPAHLIEIDLLRAGHHTVAVPRDCLPAEGWDYLVCLHRGGWRNKFHYWPVPLPQRLPRITVPLLDKDPDVVVDLQAMLDQCYEAGRLAERLDYRGACPPPLAKKTLKWINELLHRKNLRK